MKSIPEWPMEQHPTGMPFRISVFRGLQSGGPYGTGVQGFGMIRFKDMGTGSLNNTSVSNPAFGFVYQQQAFAQCLFELCFYQLSHGLYFEESRHTMEMGGELLF